MDVHLVFIIYKFVLKFGILMNLLKNHSKMF